MATTCDLRTNAELSGIRLITAESTDSNLTGIKFIVDTEIIITDTIAPYEYSLHTNDYDNGSHIVRCESTRSTGSSSGTNYTVTFNNNYEYTVLISAIMGILIFIWVKNILLGHNRGRRK